mmetsp:Transcript_32733/g.66857  ORF Transcript_32733/g.66857 Transcript_32733/m.66857 type:complete len:231 (-) Transcript_32733:73-765(-)
MLSMLSMMKSTAASRRSLSPLLTKPPLSWCCCWMARKACTAHERSKPMIVTAATSLSSNPSSSVRPPTSSDTPVAAAIAATAAAVAAAAALVAESVAVSTAAVWAVNKACCWPRRPMRRCRESFSSPTPPTLLVEAVAASPFPSSSRSPRALRQSKFGRAAPPSSSTSMLSSSSLKSSISCSSSCKRSESDLVVSSSSASLVSISWPTPPSSSTANVLLSLLRLPAACWV